MFDARSLFAAGLAGQMGRALKNMARYSSSGLFPGGCRQDARVAGPVVIRPIALHLAPVLL